MSKLWIEVNLKNLEKNFYLIKKIVGPSVKILGIVKENAYGHGLIAVAKKLSQLGVEFLGVKDFEEACLLKEAKIKKAILILSPLSPSEIKEVVNFAHMRPTIMDLASARLLNKEARKKKKVIPIHIKVDTGMGRLGISYKEAEEFIGRLAEYKNLFFEGICTHFPSADSDFKFTCFQINIFNQLINSLRQKNIVFRYIHCANSVGLLRYPQAHFNLVRPGLILYGINPYPKIKLNLCAVLSLKSKIIFTKKLDKGWGISYQRTFITKRNTRIGVVACGYADGYPWHLSNKAKVIIGDDFFPLRGRVCMDYIIVEIKEKISQGEEVILIGKSRTKSITCEDLAKWAGTIPYEIPTRLSLSIPRIYKD